MNKKKMKGFKNRLTESWSFYRLMICSSQFDRLRLPQKFGMKYGDRLSGTATLTVPTGEFRTVGITKENDSVLFSHGWKEFVEYFNVRYAYFLLFTYEGRNSRFKVNIFDPTTCEISYPSHPRVVNDDISIEVGGQKSVGDVDVVELDSDDGKEEVESHNRKDSCPLVKEVPVWLKKCGELIKAVTAAGISIPEKPFFVLQMKPYTLERGQFMPVPNTFARKHIRNKNPKLAWLETSTSSRRQWKVQCRRRKTHFDLGIGWISFARQHELKVGDICVFELIDAKNIVFRVHIVVNKSLK